MYGPGDKIGTWHGEAFSYASGSVSQYLEYIQYIQLSIHMSMGWGGRW